MNIQGKERTDGAVFLGVARGKLSEGISLEDDGCRCVVMVGIPYPYIKDPKVIMKKHYLETKIKLSRKVDEG
jgi:regulator of telomere elongation helicase 1